MRFELLRQALIPYQDYHMLLLSLAGMSALKQGLIDEALLDTRLANLFRVRMRLGHFDPDGCAHAHAATRTRARRHSPYGFAVCIVRFRMDSVWIRMDSRSPMRETEEIRKPCVYISALAD